MSDEAQVQFYCPYDLCIQTSDAIWDAKLAQIELLRAEGFTDDEIDELMM